MRILFATDGSAGAMAGAHLLARLPLGAGHEILLLSVVEHGHADRAGAALSAAEEELGGCGAPVTREVREGIAEEKILDAALEHAVDLVVIGASGHSGITRFFLGSGAERVAYHAPCPVLLARPHHDALRRVVVGIDASEASEQTVEWLRGFPLPPAAEVRLVTVLPLVEQWRNYGMMILPAPEELEPLAEKARQQARERLELLAGRLREAGKQVITSLEEDDPATGLLHLAKESETDLVVAGSHGRTQVERFLLGSVSLNLLRHAHCSVLIVRFPYHA